MAANLRARNITEPEIMGEFIAPVRTICVRVVADERHVSIKFEVFLQGCYLHPHCVGADYGDYLR